MDPREQNQDAVADEQAGTNEPVAETKAAEETNASASDEVDTDEESTDDVEGE